MNDIDLSIDNSSRELRVGFRWREPLDCDLMALVLDREGRLPRRYDIAFYNQPADRSGGVRHLGDDILAGRGQEWLSIQPDRLPDGCGEVVLILSVHRGEERQQHLGMLARPLLIVEDGSAGEGRACTL